MLEKKKLFLASDNKKPIENVQPVLNFSNFLITEARKKNSDAFDVAVLGGGLSGLVCARSLVSAGLKVVVLEASSRLGGRIYSSPRDFSDSVVEYGGEFINSDHTQILDLAEEFGLDLIDLAEDRNKKRLKKDVYYFENSSIPETEVTKEFRKISAQIETDQKRVRAKNGLTSLAQESLASYLSRLRCQDWLKSLLKTAYVAEFGLDADQQAATNFIQSIDPNTRTGFYVFGDSDERYKIKGGNSGIIEGLVQVIGRERIMTGFPVKEVIQTSKSDYTVTSSKGEKIRARKVVCTLPFTILRNLKLQLFNLSPEKESCIQELGYGLNTKLFLDYEGRPWTYKPNNSTGHLFETDVSNGWDASLAGGNKNSTYVCLFGGDLSLKVDRSLGQVKKNLVHQIPKAEVARMVEKLGKIFIGSDDLFHGTHTFVNWADYQWSRGSYSCYKPGQESKFQGLESQPVGNFFFAGEHCNDKFGGFMNGAAESGLATAKKILSL